MKKILVFFAVMLSLALTGCESRTYTEISFSDLENMIQEKQDFILFIGSETCSACSSFKITVKELVQNYNIDIKYLDISKLTSSDSDKLLEYFPFDATPTTILVKRGKEKGDDSRIVGNEKYSKVEKILKEKGYIK